MTIRYGIGCTRRRHTDGVRLQKVLDHLKTVIAGLSFTKDGLRSLPRGPSSTSVLELVLRDVPLQTREIDVCEALHAWVTPADGDEDDSSVDDEATEEPQEETVAVQGADGSQKLLDVDPQLLQHIDLKAMTAEDLCYVRSWARSLCSACALLNTAS